MRELIQFLRARYTERQEEAHSIHRPRCSSTRDTGTCDCRMPQELLADIDADIALIDMYEKAAEEYSAHGPAWDHESTVGRERTATLRQILRAQTRPFRDHPDHRRMWAP